MNKWKELILNVSTAALAICAVLAVGMRAKDMFRDDPMAPHSIDDAASYARDGHRMGAPRAIVQIVEFADYQCPFCQQSEPVLAALRERYPTQVEIVYRHFPIATHDSAVAAARAAECADSVGAFEVFHLHLMANAKAIGQKSWHWFAENAGVGKLSEFDSCVASSGTPAAVERDRVAGERLGVTATPTFLVNDVRFSGYIPLEQFDKLVRNAIDRAQPSIN